MKVATFKSHAVKESIYIEVALSLPQNINSQSIYKK